MDGGIKKGQNGDISGHVKILWERLCSLEGRVAEIAQERHLCILN
jgi:hypothetical protein